MARFGPQRPLTMSVVPLLTHPLRVLRLSAYAPRRRPANDRHQAPLFTPDGTG